MTGHEMDASTLALMAGAFGAAMGVATKGLELGLQALKSKNGASSQPASRSQEREATLLAQTHHVTHDTNRRVSDLSLAINGQLKASLTEEARQTAALQELSRELISWRLEMSRQRCPLDPRREA